MPFPRRVVRHAPRPAARRGAIAGAARSRSLAARGRLRQHHQFVRRLGLVRFRRGERDPELGVGAPHLLGPGDLERRVGRARARPRLRLDHHPEPGRRRSGPAWRPSWKYAANGKSVTFTLRPGLKFTDGTPLDAAAVKKNIERGQKQSNSNIASELAVISKVVVNSPTSFTLDLSQVDYQVPDLLAGKDGMMVSPAAFTKNAGSLATHPVGAGPFKLTSYVPDSHADLVRNPGYWDASQIHAGQLHRAVHHPAGADPGRAGVRPGQRGLHRRQPGGVGQGRRVQDRRDPVRGRQRARHPDHHRAVQQAGRGQGDQLRDRPPGHPQGAGLGLRRGRPTSRSPRASSATTRRWPTCTPTTRPRPSSCWPRPATRTA